MAPGFIDAHSHSDGALGSQKYRSNENFIKQGVTTCFFGVDGRGTPDIIRKKIKLMRSPLQKRSQDMHGIQRKNSFWMN